MKVPRFSRRKFLASMFATPVVAVAHSTGFEPKWLKVERITLPNPIGKRLVHFTDVHYKGDRPFLEKVVNAINAEKPDFACFTGDLVEESEFLSEALEILNGIQSPLYGIPGNHDFWADIDFDLPRESFARSQGQWLMDEEVTICGGSVHLMGISGTGNNYFAARPGVKNILLSHYPNGIENFRHTKFELTLAGHSHGGQVRLPYLGALVVPFGVGEYDMGMFQTSCGPLYVNPGIGYFYLNLRFCCRPEITVFTI